MSTLQEEAEVAPSAGHAHPIYATASKHKAKVPPAFICFSTSPSHDVLNMNRATSDDDARTCDLASPEAVCHRDNSLTV